MNLLSLIQDDSGALSCMRVAMLLVVGTTMFVWAWISIAKKEFVPLPLPVAGVLASAFASKAVQAKSENSAASQS